MDASEVLGFAVHWPGTTVAIGNPPAASIARRLEGYRLMHTSPGGLGVPEGGNDIAYQWCVDQAGRLWPLRTEIFRSGANGDGTSNRQFGALLLMLGPGDVPSAAMIDTVRHYRSEIWLRRYPRAVQVIGHRDVYGTDCPGALAYAMVKAGTFTHPPTHPPEDHMPTPEQIAEAVWSHKIPNPYHGGEQEASWAVASGGFYATSAGHDGEIPKGATTGAGEDTTGKRILDQLDELAAAVARLQANLTPAAAPTVPRQGDAG